MNRLRFITPTRLSLLDITSMGDSLKRGNDELIGTYDSGMKYSIALLLRANVAISIEVHGGVENRDGWEEAFTETFTFSTETSECHTGKTKELICVDVEREYHGMGSVSIYEIKEPSEPTYEHVVTGFAKNLGFNWELWQAYRELYSNMLDERGRESFNSTSDGIDFDGREGTVITLEFEDDNEFFEIYKNRHRYVNTSSPLATASRYSKTVDVIANPDGYLRIYKQSILVYEDESKISQYAYNINFGELDERRILRDVYDVESAIKDILQDTDEDAFLNLFISDSFTYDIDEFLAGWSNSNYMSAAMKNKVHQVYEEFGDVKSFEWILGSVKNQKDCKLPGRKISSLNDHIWTSIATVTVETEPVEMEVKEEDLKSKIESLYNLTIDVCLKEADITGRKVIADKYNKCLIVSKDFSIEDHMHEFLIQYVDLTQEGNIINNLATMLKNALRKA